MKKTSRIAALAGTVLCAFVAFGADPAKQPMVGQQAPAFSLPTLEGKTLRLADLRGKIVVLHFGAGW